MPFFGLKGLITLGAGVDMALGVLLLFLATEHARKHVSAVAAGVSLSAVLIISFGVQLDTLKMASGVYRSGTLISPEEGQNIFHKDGKTATVDVVRYKDGVLSIRTNGKADATMNVGDATKRSGDEITMLLTGTLPLAVAPEARTAAVIGMGSGYTSHILLTSESLERLDTIEIEAAMVEGARMFRPRSGTVFSDPRSHIIVEDAKTFFSTHDRKYDIIISAPSNPWVSGVANLFSLEFYQAIRRHLTEEGVFVQWFQCPYAIAQYLPTPPQYVISLVVSHIGTVV